VPTLNRDVIRAWLVEHNWSVARLAQECSALGDDTIPVGTMWNAIGGRDPMREGRVRLICKVTAKYDDGIPYALLVVNDGERACGR
jgi:hypothetical protein